MTTEADNEEQMPAVAEALAEHETWYLNDEFDSQLMATAAHRYCLGRSTYIVSSCISWLRHNWQRFAFNTQQLIIRDTLEWLIQNGESAPHWDDWCTFVNEMVPQLTTAQKNWLRDQGYGRLVVDARIIGHHTTSERTSGGRLPPQEDA